MKILHAPLIIADNAPVLSRYLRKLGIESDTVSFFKTWLNYKGDYNLELDTLSFEERKKALDIFLKDFFDNKIQQYDIIVFHFLDTFAKGYAYGGWQSGLNSDPDWDLKLLKDMGKKIVFYCVGSELRNNSKVIYYHLKHMHAGLNIPRPPLNQSHRYGQIWRILKYADAIVCSDSETQNHSPISIRIPNPIDLEPLESISTEYNKNEKITILHAPSNNVLKGTEFLLNVCEELKRKYNDRFELRLIQKMPHEEALTHYPGRGPAVDQINMAFGLFALEAMYLGRPTICSLQTSEFQSDDPKTIAPVWSVDNRKQFKDVLESFILDEISYDPEVGRQYVRDHFSGEVVAEQFAGLFEALINNKPVHHMITQQWFREMERYLAGQPVDNKNYYTTVTDFFLATRDIHRLAHECDMGVGLAKDEEITAKLLAGRKCAGDASITGQLIDKISTKVGKELFIHHYNRAMKIWETQQL